MKHSSLIILFFCFSGLYSQNTDLTILKSLNSGSQPGWDKAMRGVSTSVYFVMPSSVVGIWAHGYFTNNKQTMRNGYKGAIAAGFALATATGLKYLVNRTRPYTEYPSDVTRRDFGNGPYSFPSGHTTSAFVTATVLSLTCKKWYVTASSFAYAGLVGYSRLRLGVHYPSDVLAGAFIGLGSGLLTWHLDKKLNRKNKIANEKRDL